MKQHVPDLSLIHIYDKGVSVACPWVITNGASEIDYAYETEKTLKFVQEIRDEVYK